MAALKALWNRIRLERIVANRTIVRRHVQSIAFVQRIRMWIGSRNVRRCGKYRHHHLSNPTLKRHKMANNIFDHSPKYEIVSRLQSLRRGKAENSLYYSNTKKKKESSENSRSQIYRTHYIHSDAHEFIVDKLTPLLSLFSKTRLHTFHSKVMTERVSQKNRKKLDY